MPYRGRLILLEMRKGQRASSDVRIASEAGSDSRFESTCHTTVCFCVITPDHDILTVLSAGQGSGKVDLGSMKHGSSRP
jgi:hypothetical protein